MNVTPSKNMFKAMEKFTDMMCGEDPGKFKGTGAAKIRENRRAMMDFLHNFCAICMRDGAARRDEEVRQAILERAAVQKIRGAAGIAN